jgi:short-subunit dehydrogenase
MKFLRVLCCIVPLFPFILSFIISFIFDQRFKSHSTGLVVVTGASSGIGEHAAGAISMQTDFTVYAGVRKEADADRLRKKYPNIRTVILDVTSSQSISDAVDTVVTKNSNIPLIALVNNAGVQADLPVELQNSKDDRFNYNVNVFGLADTTRAFLPALRKTGDGARIINMGSLAGIVASAGSSSYSGSKFAVEGITDSLRRELEHFRISVSIIQPGYVQSKMASKAHSTSASSYGVSESQYSLYKHVFEGFFAEDRELGLNEKAAPPETTTTAAILHALQSSRPKTRYPVANVGPFPAWIVARLSSILPDRVFDLLV